MGEGFAFFRWLEIDTAMTVGELIELLAQQVEAGNADSEVVINGNLLGREQVVVSIEYDDSAVGCDPEPMPEDNDDFGMDEGEPYSDPDEDYY